MKTKITQNLYNKFGFMPEILSSMTVLNESRLTVIHSGLYSDMFNIITLKGEKIDDAVLKHTIHSFNKNNLPFALWLLEDVAKANSNILTQNNLVCIETESGMALKLTDYIAPAISISSPIIIKQMNSKEILHDWQSVFAALLPDENQQ